MEFHDERRTEISIDPARASHLRADLAEMGIRHGTIYGDLQSVCAFIQTSLGIVWMSMPPQRAARRVAPPG
jgi:hypothetical protein